MGTSNPWPNGRLEPNCDAMLRGIRPLSWGSLGGDPSGGTNYLFKVAWPDGSDEERRQTQIRTLLKRVGEELGLRFDAQPGNTDVFYGGDCDDGVAELQASLGWY